MLSTLTPNHGDRYWIGGTGAGDWSGHDFDFAFYDGTNWSYTESTEGDFSYVDDEDTYYWYDWTDLFPLASAVAQTASTVSYDNSTSGLTATDVQDAIDELDSTLDGVAGFTSAPNSIASRNDDETPPITRAMRWIATRVRHCASYLGRSRIPLHREHYL